MGQNTTDTVDDNNEFKVGVVLDFDSLVSKIGLTSMSMALSDFYSSTNDTHKRKLVLHTRDSRRDISHAASQANDLIKNVGVQAIIGPLTSLQAIIMADLGNKARVPVISFTATSPTVSTSRNPYFFRTTQSDLAQVNVIYDLVKTFGWRDVVPIYEDTEYGRGVIPYLTDAFQAIDTKVPYRSVISPAATDGEILKALYKLMARKTRVFVVHMTPSLGIRVFQKAKMIGMMSEGYAWIITDGLSNILGSFNSSVIDSMQGVLGVRPYIPRSIEFGEFQARWKKKFAQYNQHTENVELNIFGLRAYDTIWALANVLERLEITNSSSLLEPQTVFPAALTTSSVPQIGPMLLQLLRETNFNGLSGDFNLINRELQSNAFQILNVIGNGGREIGIWTTSNGILRDSSSLITTRAKDFPAPKDNLHAIIWPGESTVVPKGWVFPEVGKKLRIGVPVKEGFTEFVRVTRNSSFNNSTYVTGYCIDVFKAALEMLPYPVPYEFVPFEKADGTTAGTYDDLVYNLITTRAKDLPAPKDNLHAIIWPGESTVVPKGWVFPEVGKKLRIGVPVKEGFTEFVRVTRNSSFNNSTYVTGYCIDVFKAALEMLPYPVPYEFVPFEKADGTTAGTYDDLVYQVYAQNYDAIVGDITISANRSAYVEFTLPYTPSGFSMIVPLKEGTSNNPWILFKPLNAQLWVVSVLFFIFTGFVTWMLEHDQNPAFQGRILHQLETMFWFFFTTPAFADQQRVHNGMAKVVVVIWVFVFLILSSSYTASLTSMLTVHRLEPTVTDVHELIKNHQNVGYLDGTFIYTMLRGMGFEEANLKPYISTEDLKEAFTELRNKEDRIVAGFGEAPYNRLFLAKYCHQFALVGPTYKTEGFGFVFPRGSPLVPDISRAILTVRESDKITRIEQAWFGNQQSCADPSPMFFSTSLNLDSFWVLFLITGIPTALALLVGILFKWDTPLVRKIKDLWESFHRNNSSFVEVATSVRDDEGQGTYHNQPNNNDNGKAPLIEPDSKGKGPLIESVSKNEKYNGLDNTNSLHQKLIIKG
ncbi:glutamate receptor 2.1-like [Papaver somniferum]|uniref:glutamate receptor 2.1-like n=1 Tax=Papaver somniferum TaxID=3469 RepID=UPI000E6FFBDF|nr:glutamate receptor 2.1-like [Papaver somniferum]